MKRKQFKRQSLATQLHWVFFFIILLFVIIMIITNWVWRKSYAQQIQENAYQDIRLISSQTAEEFDQIENLSYSIIDSQTIQTQLNSINEEPAKNTRELITMRSTLNNTVNNLTRNNHSLRNIILLSSNKENNINFIANKANIINNYSTTDIIDMLPDEPAKGVWLFNDSLTRGVYARKIFSTIDLSLQHIGTLICIVDTSFLKNEKNNLPFSAEEGLFFLAYKDQMFSTDVDQKTSDVFLNKYEESPLQENQLFDTLTFQGKKYYAALNYHNDFKFIYLVPDNKVMESLKQLQLLLFALTIPIFLLLIFGATKISNQLTQPLSILANHMRKIKQTKDLESLETLEPPQKRQAEVDVLYDSYNLMIKEISTLINENYEMRLLSQEIEFQNLQSQLDPHFLYNTLDSINWIALKNEQSEISQMVTSLAFLFRKKIDTASEFSTLETELEIVEAYIHIQKVRFATRIEYIEVILINDRTIQIPKLIIQPLIENIFKHAVNKMKTTCQIVLKIEKKENQLLISISDNGPGFSDDFVLTNSQGIGLKNIQKRLSLYYGNQASLAIQSVPFKKNTIQMNLPIETTREEKEA